MKYSICLLGIIASLHGQQTQEEIPLYHVEIYNEFLKISETHKKQTTAWKNVEGLFDAIFIKDDGSNPKRLIKAYWQYLMRCSIDASFMTSGQRSLIFYGYRPILPMSKITLLKIVNNVNQELTVSVNNDECGGFEWKKLFVNQDDVQREPDLDLLRVTRLKVLKDFQQKIDKDIVTISQESRKQ